LRTDPKYGDQLAELTALLGQRDKHGDQAATVAGLHRDWMRDRKLPLELVAAISGATVRGQQVWDRARKQDSFDQFRDALAEIVSLKRQSGECLADGTSQSVYEALVDEYEPDAKVSELAPVFADLKSRLSRLVEQVAAAPHQPDVRLLKRPCSVDQQRSFSRRVAEAVGFDFSRGRLDETSHPFCTTLGPDDCRILSRYDRKWFPGGLYGTLHEAGHGMYEQGLRGDWFGLPPGSHVSLGIHESQSRLWENQVGRSRAFWRWLLPQAQATFPDAFFDVSLDQVYFAINRVQPSLIRVEADEATYNLHILIRFELEQALISGELPLADLPEAWNQQYRDCLGITPPTDADGVLQDVHWSAGLFGYFPTYTLGNLAAAALFRAAETDLGDSDAMIAGGNFQPLLGWLREHIHQHGRCYTSDELVRRTTGRPLSADDLMEYLDGKLRPLYGFS